MVPKNLELFPLDMKYDYLPTQREESTRETFSPGLSGTFPLHPTLLTSGFMEGDGMVERV